jgi:hypothetical protein
MSVMRSRRMLGTPWQGGLKAGRLAPIPGVKEN